MTYETVGGYPASPDIDMGLPEICDKCDRDCPEPCEAFKRIVAIEGELSLYDSRYGPFKPWTTSGMTLYSIKDIVRGSTPKVKADA